MDAGAAGSRTDRPGVGVGVVVVHGGEVLLVRRAHHGAGSWATPGGYLDLGESFEDCAAREVREETGVEIAGIRVVAVANDIHPDGKHNVTVWLVAHRAGGDAWVASDEATEVGWFRWGRFPEPLYLSTRAFFGGQSYPPDAFGALRAATADGPDAHST